MKDKLMELLNSSGRCDKYKSGGCAGCEYDMYEDDCEKYLTNLMADDLLNAGVIVPPVRVGQKVWYIRGGYYNSQHKEPVEIEVTEINQKWCGKVLSWGCIANKTRYRFSSIGKTVFLTKEDAEKSLRKVN